MSDDGKHDCPGPGCRERCPRNILACRSHWYQVAPAIRSALQREWRAGGVSETYLHLRDLAIKAMRPL